MSFAKQLEEAATEGNYEVRWSVLVDRPEKRDSTYRPVKAGSSMAHKQVFPNKSRAMAFAKGLIAGEADSESDYVRTVSVVQPQVNATAKWVMKMVERTRGEDGKITQRKVD